MSQAIFIRKRPRPARMTRTTSKRNIVLQEDPGDGEEGSSGFEITLGLRASPTTTTTTTKITRESRQKNEEFGQPLQFLHYCGVCRRPLGLERDIYIYRGESAFCSMECREQHMRYDAQK